MKFSKEDIQEARKGLKNTPGVDPNKQVPETNPLMSELKNNSQFKGRQEKQSEENVTEGYMTPEDKESAKREAEAKRQSEIEKSKDISRPQIVIPDAEEIKKSLKKTGGPRASEDYTPTINPLFEELTQKVGKIEGVSAVTNAEEAGPADVGGQGKNNTDRSR